MASTVQITDGDCVAAIALKNGVPPKAIWEHERNAALAGKRKSAYVLLDGVDEVFVPDPQAASSTAILIDARTTIQLKSAGETLQLCFHNEQGEPRSGLPYKLEIADEVRTGTTDDAGSVQETVPVAVTRALITLKDDDIRDTYMLLISHLDPEDTVPGIQQRLANLGYDCGDEYGAPSIYTDRALRAFQRSQGLEETGCDDPATIAALEKAYRLNGE